MQCIAFWQIKPELNVLNLDGFNSFNFYGTKSAKEYIYIKTISQECKTKYKCILKTKKAWSLKAEELKQKQVFHTKVYVPANLKKRTKVLVQSIHNRGPNHLSGKRVLLTQNQVDEYL